MLHNQEEVKELHTTTNNFGSFMESSGRHGGVLTKIGNDLGNGMGGQHKVGLFLTPTDMFERQKAVSIWHHNIGLSITSIESLARQRAVGVHKVVCTVKELLSSMTRQQKRQ
jgi:hypothetical protein